MKLKFKNPNLRDKRILFEEKPHLYYVDGICYEDSVTSFVHSFFEGFNSKFVIEKYYDYWQSDENSKYFGMSPQEIMDMWEDNRKIAANLGNNLHKDIELFYEGWDFKSISKEFSFFKKFYDDNSHLVPYRTEWTIFDEDLKLAGSIDFCSINDDGSISLFDWKRSKEIKEDSQYEGKFPINHLPDSNFWHYSLQLNIYKSILERKYSLNISEMYLVVLHPSNSSYIQLKVPNLQKEVGLMFKKRIENLG